MNGWSFINQTGAFVLDNPHRTSSLYFPLVNDAGMISAITPMLHGDIKVDQNTFLTPPVSVEDLHTSRAARNFWVNLEGYGAWSATGNSARQIASGFAADRGERVTLEAGFLWHKVTRANAEIGLVAEITNFVPATHDPVELMRVSLRNTGSRPLTFTPTAAIPIYGRSADNLRDHRHVTSLLHRIHTHPDGVIVRPTLSFDERGHKPNTVAYAVLGVEGDGAAPVGFFPVLAEFIGEGGTLDWPEAIVAPVGQGCGAGVAIDGYEALGGLRFGRVTLQPGERRSYILILAILADGADPDALVARYGAEAQFAASLADTETSWLRRLDGFRVQTADPRFDGWLKWVTLQPVLRRLCGNSFLPYHDYGRGGRGWRDLWQDLLALLITEPADVRSLLLGNFAGVRIDGSNATIIGAAPGEFKADRNNIPRVWMDHGAWPLLTVQLYIDYTGDLAFLLEEQVYFKDQFVDRARGLDDAWRPADGTQLRTATGEVYRGTVLEHLLVQHLTAFFNVGEHNIIKLEGADWNDGLDMAAERGESVAFTALYAHNLRLLSTLAHALGGLGLSEVALAAELLSLLDTLSDPVDYADVAAKQARLADYCAATGQAVSGARTTVPLTALAADLAAKADWLSGHLRRQEWLENAAGYGWFNGYYDNDGRRVEGDGPHGVRMTLTGQVFALMGDIATDAQARAIVRAARRYLYDPTLGGYRLNTDFGGVELSLGRCFGFAFGHKENGAMFSHMAVMYANALYKRGFAREGYAVLDEMYRHVQNFEVSRIYPGLPEYVDQRGRGRYPYLTGSASWYLLTLLTESFGVKGWLGDLVLTPKLVREQFDGDGRAAVLTPFAGRMLHVTYHNPARLDFGQYRIAGIMVNGHAVDFARHGDGIRLARDVVAGLAEGGTHRLDVALGG